uniref:Bifunctional inhibitor/plant lipid transfer protein/seed storage helical domain-containing protein n=1 Tax=Kalanchoe fedtschenkoi TaxID=63787 RepID=A0A7N0TYS1_KALFE
KSVPYVGNTRAKAPTPDCCRGLKQVLDHDKKCLCVIVRDRNDPDVGLQINVTLALALPALCHASANVSKCPELLQMDPNSPEAQVFYQQSKNSSSADSMSGGQGISGSPSSGAAVIAQGPTSSGSGRRSYCKAPSLRLDIAASFIFSSVLVSCFSSLL